MTSTVTSPTWTATGYIFCIYCTLYIVYLSKDGYDKAAQQFVDDYYGNGDYTSDDQSEGEEHTDSSEESESESDSESDSEDSSSDSAVSSAAVSSEVHSP